MTASEAPLLMLNLGCGDDHRSGYLNVDIRAEVRPDRVANVCDLSWLSDAAAKEIVARDILEHFSYHATGHVLREWRRVLVLGGTLHLRTPDLHRLMLYWTSRKETVGATEHYIRLLFGGQGCPEDTHRTGFTKTSLSTSLKASGFCVAFIANVDTNLVCRATAV